ncbi:hypothetical protein F5Y19DRAFT_492485 [Xylariaceae sp. FL1651]|nr:hypothetical protein F5Y19DRAFT_492485 [Xylariaceae sp. FL1651]
MSSIYTPDRVIPTYAALTGVGIALTGLRLWVRTSYVRTRLAADDAAAVVAAVFVAGATGLEIANAIIGTAGNDVKSADTERRARVALKLNWVNPILEPWAFGFIKLSLSLFYRRIFGVWPKFRMVNNASIVLLVLYILGFSLGQLFLCGFNFYLIWIDLNQHSARERCAHRGHLQFTFALFSVLTDILVIGLPLVFIGRLQISARKKWAAGVVFTLGFISTGACIARFVYNSVALKYGWFDFDWKPAPGEPAVPSPVFMALNPTLLATIEMGLGLWGANLPAIAPLMRGFHPIRLVSGLYEKVSSSWTSTSRTSRKMSTATASDEKPLRKASATSSNVPPILPSTNEAFNNKTGVSTPSLNSW